MTDATHAAPQPAVPEPLRTLPPGTTKAQALAALRRYRVLAYLTGVMLLLLCAEVIAKYLVVGLLLDRTATGPVADLFTVVAIAHGWCYVAYLAVGFVLVQRMRWSIGRFLLIAAGGVVPTMSFVVESRLYRQTVADYGLGLPEAGEEDGETRVRHRYR